MFTSITRSLRCIYLGVCLLVPGVTVQAATLNPNAVDNRFVVKSLSLHGFSAIEGYPLSISELRIQLNNERDRYGEEMTVDQLHEIADVMTIFVRRKGFVFHTIYLPPQKMTDGGVRYESKEGVLADVHVLNQTKIPSERIKRVFEPLLGTFLYAPSVEARVQALKAQAGVRVFAFYSRGSKPGDARLNLRVDSAPKYTYGLKLDNFGSVTSGEYRAIAHWNVKQLTHRFDSLSVAMLTSLDETANTYGSFNYVLPTESLNFEWDFSASNNQFELGDRFADLGLEGNATILGAGLSYRRVFEPSRKERWRLGYYSKTNNLDFGRELAQRQESQGVNLVWSKTLQLAQKAFVAQALVGVTKGTVLRSEDDEQDFSKFDGNLQLAKGVGKNGRFKSLLTAALSGQYTDVNLPNVEAFSLTGAYGVRGFEVGRFSADSALLGSVEWSFPNFARSAKNNRYLEPFVFMDWARGVKNESDAEVETEAFFLGGGGGIKFGLGKHFSGQFYGASPMDAEVDGVIIEGERVWRFELRLQ